MKSISNNPAGFLYSAEESRLLDQTAINTFSIPGYSLMSKAGEAVFNLMQEKFPLVRRALVCCGAGNNAGDGYVIARLAQQAGLDVSLVSMVNPAELKGDAQKAYQEWKSLGYLPLEFSTDLLEKTDVIIDALLGTGLQRPVEGDWKALIEHINAASVPVIAVDIPSGLSADTGSVLGAAIEADMTMSFIGLKKGMFTYHAADYCGEIFFDGLELPEAAYEKIDSSAQLLNWHELKNNIKPRLHASHKGSHGHLLVVGGNHGMAGAARMAAEAALRAGAGLVSVVTRPEHVTALVSARPELMVYGSQRGHVPATLIKKVDAIIFGPGLGQDDWAKNLLAQILETKQPKVVDADGLRLVSQEDGRRSDWVITPHPGEAANLLQDPVSVVQESRFTAIEMLQQLYGGTVVLKGSGSLVRSEQGITGTCPYGNPGMASAGMGDVLTGIIGALLAQGFAPDQAAECGVVIHALAGDRAAEAGERGLLATDLFEAVRQLVNPQQSSRYLDRD